MKGGKLSDVLTWYSFLLEAASTPGPECGRKKYANKKLSWEWELRIYFQQIKSLNQYLLTFHERLLNIFFLPMQSEGLSYLCAMKI